MVLIDFEALDTQRRVAISNTEQAVEGLICEQGAGYWLTVYFDNKVIELIIDRSDFFDYIIRDKDGTEYADGTIDKFAGFLDNKAVEVYVEQLRAALREHANMHFGRVA